MLTKYCLSVCQSGVYAIEGISSKSLVVESKSGSRPFVTVKAEMLVIQTVRCGSALLPVHMLMAIFNTFSISQQYHKIFMSQERSKKHLPSLGYCCTTVHCPDQLAVESSTVAPKISSSPAVVPLTTHQLWSHTFLFQEFCSDTYHHYLNIDIEYNPLTFRYTFRQCLCTNDASRVKLKCGPQTPK